MMHSYGARENHGQTYKPVSVARCNTRGRLKEDGLRTQGHVSDPEQPFNLQNRHVINKTFRTMQPLDGIDLHPVPLTYNLYWGRRLGE